MARINTEPVRVLRSGDKASGKMLRPSWLAALLGILCVAIVLGWTGSGQAAAPTVQSFAMPASHRSLTVPVVRFTASDDGAIAGYLLTESSVPPAPGAPEWQSTPPPFFTFSSEGNKTLYAWVKDTDDNISVAAANNLAVGQGEPLVKTAIAAGYAHTLALNSDGTAAAWGWDAFGQTNVPTGLANAVAVEAGPDYSLALKADGTVEAWGNNGNGQTDVPSDLTNVVAIAAGEKHVVALKSDGTLVAWGNNDDGQSDIPAGLSGVVAVATGYNHTVILKSDGTVEAWGRNEVGQTDVPDGLTGIVAIAAGYNHTVALKSDGTVEAWGGNSFGQLDKPAGLSDVVAVAAGYNHTGVVKSDGTVETWGWNAYGQATPPPGLGDVVVISAGYGYTVVLKTDGTLAAWGDGTYGQINTPPDFNSVVDIAAGYNHTVAARSDGTVVAWGNDNLGQTDVPADLTNVVGLAAGYNHSLALRSDGTVEAWGFNGDGQTDVPAGLGEVVALAAGFNHSLALKSDGTIVGWGNNNNGQLDVPAGLGGVIRIAAGFGHSVALKSDGTVVAWGSNDHGQTNVPSGLKNVVSVAAGYKHTVALKADGTVAAWGYNNYGQTNVPADLNSVAAIAATSARTIALLSNGTVVKWGISSYGGDDVPGDLSPLVAIAAGFNHTVALKSDGTVVAWGDRGYSETTLPPTSLDSVDPSVYWFQPAVFSRSRTVPVLALMASDDISLAGFRITGTPRVPSADGAGWTETPPNAYKVPEGGIQTLYAWAKDGAGNVSLARSATTEVSIPYFGPISPREITTEQGRAQAFDAVYRHADGNENIKFAEFLVNTKKVLKNALRVRYNTVTNRLILFNDGGKVVAGTCIPGAAGKVIVNSQGQLNCEETTVQRSGMRVRIHWSLTPSLAFASTPEKKLFLKAIDKSGNRTLWRQKGSWTILASNTKPNLGSLTPSVLSSEEGVARTFKAVYRDPDGYSNLKWVDFRIGTSPDGSASIWGRYFVATNRLRVFNDSGTALLTKTCRPGQSRRIENSQGILICRSTSVEKIGNRVIVKWRVKPKAGFTGAKNLMMRAQDYSNATTAFASKGTWTISGAAAGVMAENISAVEYEVIDGVPVTRSEDMWLSDGTSLTVGGPGSVSVQGPLSAEGILSGELRIVSVSTAETGTGTAQFLLSKPGLPVGVESLNGDYLVIEHAGWPEPETVLSEYRFDGTGWVAITEINTSAEALNPPVTVSYDVGSDGTVTLGGLTGQLTDGGGLFVLRNDDGTTPSGIALGVREQEAFFGMDPGRYDAIDIWGDTIQVVPDVNIPVPGDGFTRDGRVYVDLSDGTLASGLRLKILR